MHIVINQNLTYLLVILEFSAEVFYAENKGFFAEFMYDLFLK